MNPLLQGQSGNTPETSGNASKTNQGTNEDDPQSDPHPEASIFSSQTIRNSGQETCCDTVCSVVVPFQSGSVHGNYTYRIRASYMNYILWNDMFNTYRLHELHICAEGGYVTTTCP